jgi:2'-5' RNA ligase
MKLVLSIFSIFISSLSFAHEDWSVKGLAVEKTLKAPFVSHENDETPYLSLNLNYEPIKEFLERVDRYSYRPLKNRNEAHITLITPVEFKDDLSKYISIKEINQIAEKLNVQQSSYKPICLGRGSADQNTRYLETYFIVVESDDLLKIRKEIAALYKSRGGSKFDPTHFYPHITLGFTERDLHESDGVIKNSNACMKTLHFSPLPSNVPGVPVANSFYVDKNKKGGAIIRGNAPLNHRNLEALKSFGVSEVIIFKNDKAGEVKSEIGGLYDIGFSRA